MAHYGAGTRAAVGRQGARQLHIKAQQAGNDIFRAHSAACKATHAIAGLRAASQTRWRSSTSRAAMGRPTGRSWGGLTSSKTHTVGVLLRKN